MSLRFPGAVAAGLLLTLAPSSRAAPAGATPPWLLSPAERQRLQELTEADHADMMAQLGITVLRPGRDGSPSARGPNAANYDEAQANPFPNYPDPLVGAQGQAVTTAAAWWQQRRPEIAAAFEQDIIGRVPAHVPAVT